MPIARSPAPVKKLQIAKPLTGTPRPAKPTTGIRQGNLGGVVSARPTTPIRMTNPIARFGGPGQPKPPPALNALRPTVNPGGVNRAAPKPVGSPAGPHGAIVAPSGANKPPPKSGYTTIGTGKGGWIYKPVRPTGGAAPAPPQPSGTGSGPTVQAPGAPPGVPDTSQQTGANTYAIPSVPADEMAKGQAQQAFDAAMGSAKLGIQSAAFSYGDPSLMSQWGLSQTANPNSALALAALRAQQQQQASDNARERAGTFFSGLHQNDLSQIGNAQQRSQVAGYTRYQNALAKFNAAVNAATVGRQNAFDTANLDERQSAINTLPTAQGTSSGGFDTGTTSATGKIQTPTNPKNAKVPLLKAPSPPKTKTTKPKSGGKVTTSKGSSKVGSVKSAARVPGKRR